MKKFFPIFLSFLLIFISTSISFATESMSDTAEESAASTKQASVRICADVDDSITASIISVSVFDTENACFIDTIYLYRTSNYSKTFEIDAPGKYEITDCALINDALAMAYLDPVSFEVFEDQSVQVDISITNLGSLGISEKENEDVSEITVVHETEDTTKYTPVITISENVTNNETENTSSFSFKNITLVYLGCLGFIALSVIIIIILIKKRNEKY